MLSYFTSKEIHDFPQLEGQPRFDNSRGYPNSSQTFETDLWSKTAQKPQGPWMWTMTTQQLMKWLGNSKTSACSWQSAVLLNMACKGFPSAAFHRISEGLSPTKQWSLVRVWVILISLYFQFFDMWKINFSIVL